MNDIRNNILMYYNSVEMTGGYFHNLPETLKMTNLYYNSKFKSGTRDRRGFRKFFYNIVKPACDIATKFIDLDTKDIILMPAKADEEFRVWMMQKDLKVWLKKEKFGNLLNKIGFNYPKMGHVVLKKSKGNKWNLVNIENLRTDPSVEWLTDSSFVYEVHLMSRGDIESMGSWDKEVVKDLLEHSKDESFLIYECFTKKGNKWEKEILADIFTIKGQEGETIRGTESLINTEEELLPSKVLFKGKVSKLPYRELKWESVPGRWLGFGFVEYLEENQIATNEAENLERKGLMYTSLKLFQTRDDSIGGSNVLTDAENGDILKVDGELTPISMEERNLAEYNATRSRWDTNTERKTFSFDIARGEQLPSRTPLGVANLSAATVASYFELKRENMGLFIKDLLTDDIIPEFKNKTQREHILTFLGSDDELDKLDKTVTRLLVDEVVVKHAKRTGFFPSRLVREDAERRVKDSLNRQKNRYLNIPDSTYDTLEYFVDILITGEQLDTGSLGATLTTALQLVGTNPAMLQNKSSRTIFFKLLELSGVSPVELNLLSEDIDKTPVPQGGSVAGAQPGPAGTIPGQRQI